MKPNGIHRAGVSFMTLGIGLAWLFVPLSWAPPGARAQEGGTGESPNGQVSKLPPPTAVEDAEAPTELTLDDVRSRVTQVQGSADLTETQRNEILSYYSQAIEQLTAAANWSQKLAEFRSGRDDAPELVKQAQVELAGLKEALPSMDDLGGASLKEVAALLDEANRVLRDAQNKAKELDDEAANRDSRRQQVPGLISESNKRLEDVNKGLSDRESANLPPQVGLAKRTLLRSQKKANETQIQLYEEELQFYAARRELLSIRREIARGRRDRALGRVSQLEAEAKRLRREEVEQQKEQANQLRSEIPQLDEIAKEYEQLAVRRAKVVEELDKLSKKAKVLQGYVDEIDRDFRFLQESVGIEGAEDIVGPKLREKRSELRQLANERLELEQRLREKARTRLLVTEIEDEYAALDVDSAARSLLEPIIKDRPSLDREVIERQARELFQARRDLLEALKQDLNNYFDRLSSYATEQEKLLTKVDAFREFVDQHVLWTRSTSPLTKIQFPDRWYFPDTTKWSELAKQVLGDAVSHPIRYVLFMIVVSTFCLTRLSLGRKLAKWGKEATPPSCDTFVPTAKALLGNLIVAGLWPWVLAFIGSRLISSVGVRGPIDLANAIGTGLLHTAYVLFLIQIIRRIAVSKGLAECHFAWRQVDLRMIRRYLFLLSVIAVPATFVVSATLAYPVQAWQDSFGRLAIIVAMVALSLITLRIMHPAKGAFAAALGKSAKSWSYNLRSLWYTALIAIPLVVAGLSAAGFHFTATELLNRLCIMSLVLIASVVVHASLMRLLLVAQRRLAIRRAEVIKASKKEKDATIESPQELRLDLVAVGDQTRSLLRVALVVAFTIGIWSAWSDVLPALSFIDQVRLWSYTVTNSESQEKFTEWITLGNLLSASFAGVAAIILAKNIPGFLEITILQRLPFDRGGRFAITSMSRYTIGVVGILVSFSFLGVSWSSVQWLIAAMTVGLGFGLQEIFANFVSGLILLFERPIRVGDTVTVGGISGEVTQIRIRATTITDWDRKELVIPNKEFVTGQVVNWSLTDPILRVIVPVGIAYGSDVELAESILQDVVKETEHVLSDPKPKVLFMAFGESSLNFEVRVFIPNIDYFLKVRHALLKTIDAEFRKAGIEIAFPQRDIHIRSIEQSLPFTQYSTEPGEKIRLGDRSSDSADDPREEN